MLQLICITTAQSLKHQKHCSKEIKLYSASTGSFTFSEIKQKKWKKEKPEKSKAKNIITSALGMDEYFRVSNCKSAKDMWDTLQVTHEDTIDVKRSRTNTLTHEYELFRMNSNESI